MGVLDMISKPVKRATLYLLQNNKPRCRAVSMDKIKKIVPDCCQEPRMHTYNCQKNTHTDRKFLQFRFWKALLGNPFPTCATPLVGVYFML